MSLASSVKERASLLHPARVRTDQIVVIEWRPIASEEVLTLREYFPTLWHIGWSDGVETHRSVVAWYCWAAADAE